MSWLCPAFCSWDMNIFLVLSTFPSSPISFLQTNNPSQFPNNYTLQSNSPFMISTSSNELKCISLYCFYPDTSIMFKTSLQQFPGLFLNQTAECTKRLYLNRWHTTDPIQFWTYFSASHSTSQCSSVCLGLCDLKFDQISFKKFRSYFRSIKLYLHK
jgi:hypothetical protein